MTSVDRTLFKGKVGGTGVFLSVSYSDDEGITISGQDLGQAPKEVFGVSEYEYWRSVKPQHVDDVFSALLRQAGLPDEPFSGEGLVDLIYERFGGDHDAEKNFRGWCEENRIPTQFSTWTSD